MILLRALERHGRRDVDPAFQRDRSAPKADVVQVDLKVGLGQCTRQLDARRFGQFAIWSWRVGSVKVVVTGATRFKAGKARVI